MAIFCVVLVQAPSRQILAIFKYKLFTDACWKRRARMIWTDIMLQQKHWAVGAHHPSTTALIAQPGFAPQPLTVHLLHRY